MSVVQLADRLRWRRDRYGLHAQVDDGSFYGIYHDGPCCEYNPQPTGYRVMLCTWSEADLHHHDLDLGFASTAEQAQTIAERHRLAMRRAG
jgi:hypothetical protein